MMREQGSVSQGGCDHEEKRRIRKGLEREESI